MPQQPPNLVQGVVPVAAVAEGGLLHPAPDLVDDLRAELDHMEGIEMEHIEMEHIEHGGSVVELGAHGVEIAAKRVQSGVLEVFDGPVHPEPPGQCGHGRVVPAQRLHRQSTALVVSLARSGICWCFSLHVVVGQSAFGQRQTRLRHSTTTIAPKHRTSCARCSRRPCPTAWNACRFRS